MTVGDRVSILGYGVPEYMGAQILADGSKETERSFSGG